MLCHFVKANYGIMISFNRPIWQDIGCIIVKIVPDINQNDFEMLIKLSLRKKNCPKNPGGKKIHKKFKSVFKVLLYNTDITAMCSVTKCKQSYLIDH